MPKNISILFIVLAMLPLFSLSSRPPQELTGQVRLTGTAMFPQLVLRTHAMEYIFDTELFDEFKKFDGSIITITAKTIQRKKILADGSKTFTEQIIIQAKLSENKEQAND